jgi:hypothetical protein
VLAARQRAEERRLRAVEQATAELKAAEDALSAALLSSANKPDDVAAESPELVGPNAAGQKTDKEEKSLASSAEVEELKAAVNAAQLKLSKAEEADETDPDRASCHHFLVLCDFY